MKITGAMRMISISKLRAAQGNAERSRLYCDGLRDIALRIAAKSNGEGHPALLLKSNPKKATLVVIASQKGFCGNLNENLFNQINHFVQMMEDRGTHMTTFVAGAKGFRHFSKGQIECERLDVGIEDLLVKIKLEGICRHLLQLYLSGETDQIFLAYQGFESITRQRVELEMFLPIWVRESERPKTGSTVDYLYEPSKDDVVDMLIQKTLRSTFFQALLESWASELAARMVTMDQALRNARDVVGQLTKQYHHVRQTVITRDLLDIVGGAEALRNQQ